MAQSLPTRPIIPIPEEGDWQGLAESLRLLSEQSHTRHWPQRSITAARTLDSTDCVILGDASGGGFSVTLPAAANNKRRIYVIKNVGASNTVTVDGNASETIDGATTKALSTQYDSIMIQCDGSGWLILADIP